MASVQIIIDDLGDFPELHREPDIDTTPVEYTVRYDCGHTEPRNGIAEDVANTCFEFNDGVLHVIGYCGRCCSLASVLDGLEVVDIDEPLAFDDGAWLAEQLYDSMVEDGEGPDLSHNGETQ